MELSPGKYVIFFFQGVRKAARILGRDPSAISKWGKRGCVPFTAQVEILTQAKSQGWDITGEDLILGRRIDELEGFSFAPGRPRRTS